MLNDNKDENECAEAKERIKSMLFKASKVCASCKKKSGVEKFLACAKCVSVFYCNRNCQIAHWKAEGGHKMECRAP